MTIDLEAIEALKYHELLQRAHEIKITLIAEVRWLEDKLKRYRELGELVGEIARFEGWGHPASPASSRKTRVAELLKEVKEQP